MSQSYILVEGINIYANVFDTNQLSVIRGSSFLLKHAIDKISSTFISQLQDISTGASSGIFLVKGKEDPAELTKQIANELNKPNTGFDLLTFIVEYCVADNLLQAKEQLIAQLRIQQMQSISQVPDFIEVNNTELAQPDELEGRRIATEKYSETIQKKKRQLSHSVYQRWRRGIKLKQNYYFQEQKIRQSKELEQLRAYDFCTHFEDLADNPEYTKLNAKIAVIYMDGNRFSKLQKNILEQAANQISAQQDFDHKIQNYRSEFLLNLLLQMIDQSTDSGFQQTLLNNQKTLRFETLLWGGDEMLFVMPAWSGFEFIQYFYQITQDWNIADKALSHAAGLVFCSANTPINNVRDLAQSLAETVKNTGKEDSPNKLSGRAQNAWNYIVLESIDYPSHNDIADFNARHYGKFFDKPPLISAAKDWQAAKVILDQLINQRQFPRRQLYRIVQTLNAAESPVDKATLTWSQVQVADKADENLSAQEKQEIRLLEVAENKALLAEQLSQVAMQLFSLEIERPEQRLCLWVYLYDLWDYLVPQTTQQGDQQ